MVKLISYLLIVLLMGCENDRRKQSNIDNGGICQLADLVRSDLCEYLYYDKYSELSVFRFKYFLSNKYGDDFLEKMEMDIIDLNKAMFVDSVRIKYVCNKRQNQDLVTMRICEKDIEHIDQVSSRVKVYGAGRLIDKKSLVKKIEHRISAFKRDYFCLRDYEILYPKFFELMPITEVRLYKERGSESFVYEYTQLNHEEDVMQDFIIVMDELFESENLLHEEEDINIRIPLRMWRNEQIMNEKEAAIFSDFLRQKYEE